jgi:murein peptide amidase A
MRPPATAYEDLVREWASLRASRGVDVRALACAGAERELLVVDIQGAGGPAVALCCGVHGDEPAAPWALLSIVRDGLLDARFSYRVWPCTNPTGYELGTRENAGGRDINRSFSSGGLTPEALTIMLYNEGARFDLSLDLHEDFEAGGFYCYEPVVDGEAPFGAPVVQAMDDAGLAVHDLDHGFDLGYPEEAHHLRSLERGRVLPDVAGELAHFDGLPYSMYLLGTGTAKRTMTLESPRSLRWVDRIATHRIAVVAAMNALGERLDGREVGTERAHEDRLY